MPNIITVLSEPSLPIMETTAFPLSMKYMPSAGSPYRQKNKKNN